MGSPVGVPVPWHSTMAVCEKSSMPASWYARRMRASCASVLGCDSPGVLPSTLCDVARMTARTGFPSRIASARGFTKMAVAASPRA